VRIFSVSTRQRALSKAHFERAFSSVAGQQFPPILSPKQLADLLGLSVKTIYEWVEKGRLDGAFRRRGKHLLLWRDRALDILFNGKDWTNDD
jgi:excisionase family DNA binding protein